MRTPHSLTLLAVALVLVSIVAACSSSAASSSPSATTPTVSGAWVRPPMGADRPAAGYMIIANAGSEADALIAAASAIAISVEIHETTTDASGTMGMQPVDKIEVPAGGSVSLEPGGYHLMLMGVTEMPPVGEMVEITLTFETGGDVVVQAEVKAG